MSAAATSEKARTNKQPLTPWRYRLTVRATPVRTKRSEAEGTAFRACREACELSRLEVAAGWGVEPATIHALEDGWLAFHDSWDLESAISQLWCWRGEKR